VRIVRVVRVIRVLTFFRELRLMIDSIIASLKSFVWCLIVLLVLFFIFGICMTTAVSGYLSSVYSGAEPWDDPNVELLRAYFGTLDASMLSFFMAMSGGRDWAEFYDVLHRLSLAYRMLFVLFVAFAVLAVVNVVTGVFVECAIATSGSDRDTLIKEELTSQARYLEDMRDVFEEMDQDGTDSISLDEFEGHLNDDRVIAYFRTLKLDVSDARTLFMLLDHDRSGSVEIEEFIEGCTRLKGDSRSLDVAVMRFELAWLRNSFQTFEKAILQSLPGVSQALAAATDDSMRGQDATPVDAAVENNSLHVPDAPELQASEGALATALWVE